MQLSQSGIALLYGYALVLGVFLGFFYDLLQFPGMFFSKKDPPEQTVKKVHLRKRRAIGIFVFLGDFLFCIFACVLIILLFYEHNQGKIRPFAFCLLLGAYFLYRITVGKLVQACLFWLAGWLRKLICLILHTIWNPIHKMLLFIRRAIQNRIDKAARKRNTKRLLRLVELDVAGLLPGGVRLQKKKKEKMKGRRTHGGGKREKDHSAKQKSMA